MTESPDPIEDTETAVPPTGEAESPAEETPSSAPSEAPLPDENVKPVEAEASPEVVAKPRSRYERKEQASADALRGLIRDYLMEKYPSLMEKGEEIQILLQVSLTPGEPGELCFSPDLRRQLSDQLAEAAAPEAEFRDGAVFDFQAGSNESPDCRPPDATQVFAGYDSMGRPQWQAYFQLLLDARDPDVDRLHAKNARPVVRIQRGKDLKAAQLGSYGRASRAYSLLGQLTTGYYRLPSAFVRVAGDDRLALTFQIVETRTGKNTFALRLNTLAGGLLDLEINDLFQEPAFRDVARAREGMVKELERLEAQAGKAHAAHDTEGFQKAMRRIPRLLGQMQEVLEGRGENRGGMEKGRPPDDRWKADALEAEPEIFFKDVERDSWVLLGGRGQAHVFGKNGNHITSFKVTPDLIEKRILAERWRAYDESDAPVLAAVRAAASKP
ncbi:MAG: hypothetical protein JJU29_07980 [Verrucomicrobia bacterium]|nr:hypothetical protein [Verrucomicrobiota bacterium]MCH8511897.1 hypothetical protein [Kiritimatiellia bacterium]